MRISPQSREKRANDIGKVARIFPFKRLVSGENSVHFFLAGACDPASVAIRRGQSYMRMDRRPSYFSEAGIFTGRDDEVLSIKVVGADPTQPESQGIVRTSSGEYSDTRRYPNLVLVSLTVESDSDRRVASFRRRTRNPEAIRDRFDTWAMLAGWQHYLFEPDRSPNPMHSGVSHPGATFVRWMLDAVGIEGAPGATEEADSPEHLWALAKWWSESMADPAVGVSLDYYRVISDPGCTVSD